MTDFINVTSNAAEIEARLNAMTVKVAKHTVRKAVREGQKIIQAEAKGNAAGMVGGKMGNIISQSLVIRTPQKQKPFSYLLMVRPHKSTEGLVYTNKSEAGKGVRHYIPAAIEYGHAKPYDSKKLGGSGSKTVAPIPFMRTAVDQEGARALQRAVAILRFGVESEFANPIQVSVTRRAIGTSPFALLSAGTSLAVR